MDSASGEHEHDHGHEHVYGHGHAPHDHAAHSHAQPARPPASLLRMSAMQRMTLSGGAVAAIWVGVFWAIG
jgi:hypothetical protein